MKYRTILCEDNEHVREILNFLLDERGHEIFSYEDAGDCPLNSSSEFKCYHENPCSDIIISDVSMPKLDGLKFVEKIKKSGCKVKNIALISGYWSKEDISRAKEIGCSVFHKPLKPAQLNEWLDNCEKNISPNRLLSQSMPCNLSV
jgi:two-component system response regulator YesN